MPKKTIVAIVTIMILICVYNIYNNYQIRKEIKQIKKDSLETKGRIFKELGDIYCLMSPTCIKVMCDGGIEEFCNVK